MTKTSRLTWSTQLSTQAGPHERGLSHSKTIHPKGTLSRALHVHTCFHFYVILHYVCEIFYEVKQNMKRNATVRFVVNQNDTGFSGHCSLEANNFSVLFTEHLTEHS